jgi:hypothetical protein
MALVASPVRQNLVRDPEITGWYSTQLHLGLCSPRKPIQKSHLTLHGTEAILQEAFQNAKKRFTKGLRATSVKDMGRGEDHNARRRARYRSRNGNI